MAIGLRIGFANHLALITCFRILREVGSSEEVTFEPHTGSAVERVRVVQRLRAAFFNNCRIIREAGGGERVCVCEAEIRGVVRGEHSAAGQGVPRVQGVQDDCPGRAAREEDVPPHPRSAHAKEGGQYYACVMSRRAEFLKVR